MSGDGDTQMRDESKLKQNGGDAKNASHLVVAICSSLDQAMALIVAAHKQATASNQRKLMNFCMNEQSSLC